MKQCAKQNIIFLMLLTAVSLCSCGSKRSIYRNEEHLYFYNGQSYKNDGEIFLSEKETEYVELIEEIPEGIEGAEWYNQFYQYADWLLLGINGERYFLLLQYPEFDTKNRKKVPEALNLLACGTFPDFAAARYSLCLLVSAQIFFIFLIGTISLDVQKPNAS
jgi:hypothetical protein